MSADVRKTLAQMKAEYDQHRHMCNKRYVHKGSGDEYIFLFPAFDEASNECTAIYALASMPWLKLEQPMGLFIEMFEAIK